MTDEIMLDVTYEGENIQDDWFVTTTIIKQENWQDTKKKAEEIKSKLLQGIKLIRLIEQRLEEPNKVIINRVIENEIRDQFKKLLECSTK